VACVRFGCVVIDDEPRLSTTGRDERGVVYVEFLAAFFPLFLLVLWICQTAFVASAKAVVEHSAWAAARSAVVILADNPSNFGGIYRNDAKSTAANATIPGIADVMERLALDHGAFGKAAKMRMGDMIKTQVAQGVTGMLGENTPSALADITRQLPSRMTPIRAAAYLPLLPLASTDGSSNNRNIRSAIHDDFFSRMANALAYTRAATAVTLHGSRDDEAVFSGIFPKDAEVTARVAYLYTCEVPIVRLLMCRSYDAILSDSDATAANALKNAESSSALAGQLSKNGRYLVLISKATLVNQGAKYESDTDDSSRDGSE
jgi:hypothetical protein